MPSPTNPLKLISLNLIIIANGNITRVSTVREKNFKTDVNHTKRMYNTCDPEQGHRTH